MMEKITNERIGEYMKQAMLVLRENDGEMAAAEVVREVERRLTLSAYEREALKKTGKVRWETYLRFHTINCVKAGWIVKKKGTWYLTPEGEAAINLGPTAILKQSQALYHEWKEKQPKPPDEKPGGGGEPESTTYLYEAATDDAREEIRGFIRDMDPYAFQDFVAAVLRGMGYYTPFVAPKGKDGGVDILAYRDPFGVLQPRMKVQVKHQESKVSFPVIQQLLGALNKDGDSGLIVSSGGFTSDAVHAVRNAQRHIEMVGLDNLIDLWETNYDRLADEDKALLPLRRVFFIAPEE